MIIIIWADACPPSTFKREKAFTAGPVMSYTSKHVYWGLQILRFYLLMFLSMSLYRDIQLWRDVVTSGVFLSSFWMEKRKTLKIILDFPLNSIKLICIYYIDFLSSFRICVNIKMFQWANFLKSIFIPFLIKQYITWNDIWNLQINFLRSLHSLAEMLSR